ncbi:hypothetical protein ACH347_30000 [Saccharopolyspora sp. 5N102]|uniref:hypothetical protein n=1 Tax=Saccharopolyspora sp. 5N102 TaxID=3375155 RepID=UPI0037A009D5
MAEDQPNRVPADAEPATLPSWANQARVSPNGQILTAPDLSQADAELQYALWLRTDCRECGGHSGWTYTADAGNSWAEQHKYATGHETFYSFSLSRIAFHLPDSELMATTTHDTDQDRGSRVAEVHRHRAAQHDHESGTHLRGPRRHPETGFGAHVVRRMGPVVPALRSGRRGQSRTGRIDDRAPVYHSELISGPPPGRDVWAAGRSHQNEGKALQRYDNAEVGMAMNEALDAMATELDLTERETMLLNFLVTASGSYLKGDAETLSQVIEDEYAGERAIIGRQLINTLNAEFGVYEHKRSAALANLVQQLNELAPASGTRWRAEPVPVTEAAQERGRYERIELWRLSDELATELDVLASDADDAYGREDEP